MRVRSRSTLSIISIVLLLTPLLLQQVSMSLAQDTAVQSPQQPRFTYRKLTTSEQAESMATALTGIQARSRTEQATLGELAIPGLAENWSGRRVWHSRLDGVELQLGTKEHPVTNRNINGFDVWFDDRGALILMRSVPVDSAQELRPPLPERQEALRIMERTANRYVGLPSEPPQISVAELLNKAHEQGFAALDQAREIRIKRVLQSREAVGEPARAVWIVNVRGIPPYPGRGPGAVVSAEDRSHLRLVYDETGTLLFADNLMY